VTIPATRPNTWAPLRHAFFRNLWLAGLVSNLGTFMHTVGAAWTVTELSSSPTVVSLVQTAWTVPGFALALLAGALADVLDRRRLIIVTQLGSAAIAAALGVLELTNTLDVPLLLALTFALSTAGTLAAPAFMALTPDLIPRDQLPSALGLNSISMNVAQSAGPALAGLLIALAGPGAVFVANAVSFVGVMVVLQSYRPAATESLAAEHVAAAVRTGVRYFRNSPRLQVLAARLVLSLTVTSALLALLPVVARTRLDAGAAAFGVLSAAGGLGAVAAVWVLPRASARWSPDIVAVGAAATWSVGTAVFASTRSMPIAASGLALAGAGSMATMNVVFSMYTMSLPSWVRGRASSVAMLVVWLGASVGAVGWGAMASALGSRTTLTIAACAHSAVTAVAAFALRLGPRQTVDTTPVSWAMPEMQLPPEPEAGPVKVTVEWRIDPTRVDDFAEAMRPVRRQRQRDGGYNWGLFHDLEDPGRLVESFVVTTWAEHERQHHRSIAADADEQAAARALLVGDGPVVHHLIAAQPPRTARVRNERSAKR
jgi:MFS family permease